MKKRLQRLVTFTHSIRFRLVLWYAAILSLVLFAFSAFVYINQLRDIRGDTTYRIERKLAETLRVVTLTPDNQLVIPDGILQDSDVLILFDSTGTTLASHGPLTAEQVLQVISKTPQRSDPGENSNAIFARVSAHQNYVFIDRAVTDLQGNLRFALFGSLFDTYGLLDRLVITLSAGSLLTLAIALGGGFWLADRAMRPVHIITRTAQNLGETDLSLRLNLKAKDELGELADTFDAMLARLETAFKRQRQFVADASHELRTPLTIVNLETSRALAAKRSPQEYQRALGVIQSENSFMSRMVNDLLTLARMDNSQSPLEKVELDLSDIALEAVERLESLATRSLVHLETGELPETLIEGNRQYLLQMVSNLIENGIKYAGGSDPQFVRVETGSDAGSAWLRVSDNGPGIPPGHLEHLFDRFYRADESRTRGEDDAPAGTGLGLSIVQSIAQAHGGTVRVESAPGEGTAFVVTLKA